MRFKIKINLLEISDPEIWRVIWVPMGISFDDLHNYIQAAMGWQNEHLYEFKENENSLYFNIISPYFEDNPGIKGNVVIIDDILFAYYNSGLFQQENTKEKLYYVYDMGDDWQHELMILDFDGSKNLKPEILDGAGACPPENSGGISGYQRMKVYIHGKMDAKEYYDWYSAQNAEKFDINKFDIIKAKARLKKVKVK